MVDNRNRGNTPGRIHGVRMLTKDEVDAANYVKEVVGDVLTKLFNDLADLDANEQSDVELSRRWVAIARTHFEQGQMALTRAITRPEGF